MNMRRVVTWSATLVTSLLFGGTAHAEWGYMVGLGGSYSDNATKATSDERGETSFDASLAIDGEQRGERLETSLDTDLYYATYQIENTDQFRGGVDGRLLYRAIPSYLHFTGTENFGQIRQNLALPDSPQNRVNFNVLSVGADVIVPFGKRTSLVINGTGSTSTTGQDQFDNRNTAASASLHYGTTERSHLALTVSDTKTDFTNISDLNNYRIQEASLGFFYSFNANLIDVMVGRTRVKYSRELASGAAETPERTLLRAAVSRAIGSRSVFGLSVGSSYSDAGSAFVLEQSIVGVDQTLLAGAVGTDAFRSEYAYLTLGLEAVKSTLDLSLGIQRNIHDLQTTLDSKSQSAQLQIARRISPRVEIFWRETFYSQDLDPVVSPFKPEEWNTMLGMNWRVTSRLVFVFDVTHANGVIGLSGERFDANTVTARFRYGSPRR